MRALGPRVLFRMCVGVCVQARARVSELAAEAHAGSPTLHDSAVSPTQRRRGALGARRRRLSPATESMATHECVGSSLCADAASCLHGCARVHLLAGAIVRSARVIGVGEHA
eukprot:3437979-Pleurochrysis_carterae.AAC.2